MTTTSAYQLFGGYGIFRDDCEAIANADYDDVKRSAKIRISTICERDGVCGLYSEIIDSIALGLRYINIDTNSYALYSPDDALCDKLAEYLWKHGISDITITGSELFKLALVTFLNNGWMVQGVHTLPTARETIHLTRPALTSPKADWVD